MSRRSEAVIAAFEKLPRAEREEVVTELLRRAALSEHVAPSHDELVIAADEVFQTLDRIEAGQR